MSTNEQLKELLQYVKSLIVAGEEFVLEQAPQIAQEIIMYAVAKGILSLVITCVLVCAFIIIYPKWTRTISVPSRYGGGEVEEIYPVKPHQIGAYVCLTVCMSISLVASIHLGVIMMKALIAPRLFIIDYITAMLR